MVSPASARRALLLTSLLVLSTGTNASAAVPGPVEAAKPRPLQWDFERSAFSGPTLDPTWFAGRRAVVYLIPDGARTAARHSVAQVLKSCWSAGDFTVSHVFVSSTPGRTKFVAGRRIGLRDMAQSLARELGQDEEYVATNEEHLREEVVFFVHDPDATTWTDLLGCAPEAAPVPAIVLLDSGRVSRVIGISTRSEEAEDGAAEEDENASADAPAGASVESTDTEDLDPVYDVRLHLPEPRPADP